MHTPAGSVTAALVSVSSYKPYLDDSVDCALLVSSTSLAPEILSSRLLLGSLHSKGKGLNGDFLFRFCKCLAEGLCTCILILIQHFPLPFSSHKPFCVLLHMFLQVHGLSSSSIVFVHIYICICAKFLENTIYICIYIPKYNFNLLSPYATPM